jgi:hypothetical protein
MTAQLGLYLVSGPFGLSDGESLKAQASKNVFPVSKSGCAIASCPHETRCRAEPSSSKNVSQTSRESKVSKASTSSHPRDD